MVDVLTKEQRSYCMSQIRGKNTKPEVILRKALWSMGHRHRAHPESQILFDLPLYTLLSQKPLAADDIEQLLLQYRKLNAPGIYWELPANSMLNPNPGRPIYGRSNSQALAESGSVDAFAIILGLIRQERLLDLDGSVESKIKRNAAISYHLIQAARAFPNMAQHPVFNEI